ncbi:class I SAM-dependent methyltransferase [Frigidibacter sp. SD6-1]|uniref:class I SAM-dependent methyltransferase n=1 Tax=Frigidibacter sp. SD6-1 TaxID=3032581 RepID=UPI0024DF7605|nr:class I SAM-dependent methyltransferase [Frigidibacter sp. SD6-1]
MELAQVRRSYAMWAPVYDATFGSLTTRGRRMAVAHVNARGGSVLEVGVGTGLSLASYGRHLDVTGIDYSHEMLAKAREKVAAQGLTQVSALRQMDARALDLPDARFDTVTALHVLSVVPEPQRVMAEVARVLKPGGEVVIVNHFARESGPMAMVERLAAPLAGRLGWHPDFRREQVLTGPELVPVVEKRVPPLGLMSFMVLRKRA